MARGNQIVVGVIDGQDRESSLTLTLDVTQDTIAEAQTVLDAALVDLALVTGLGFTTATLSVPLTVTPTAPQGSSNIDEGARMKILTTDGKRWSFRIPGPIKDVDGVFEYITAGEVDTSHAGIVAFFANYLAAGALRFGDVAQQVMAVNGIQEGTLERA